MVAQAHTEIREERRGAALWLFLGISWTIGLSLFYVFARRRAAHGRTFAEFLELSALCLGFTLPALLPFFVLPAEAAGVWALVALRAQSPEPLEDADRVDRRLHAFLGT